MIRFPKLTISGTMSIETRALEIQTAEPETAKGQRSENQQLVSKVETNLIATPQWTFAQLVGKKRLISSITLDTTHTPDTLLFSYRNNHTTFLATFPNIQVIDFFRFLRYDLVFEFEIQSHFQQQGALILNTIPGSLDSQVYPFLGLPQQPLAGNRFEKVLYPHDFITLGHSGNYEAILPWIIPRSMGNLRAEAGATGGSGLAEGIMNSIHLSVFDPLRVVASAVNVATIRVWVHAENVQFSGYHPEY